MIAPARRSASAVARSPGHERVAVAVVLGARELARDQAAGARRRSSGASGARRAPRRTPAGRGGALARSSASISFEQMGHFAVIRLWRQNSDVMRS